MSKNPEPLTGLKWTQSSGAFTHIARTRDTGAVGAMGFSADGTYTVFGPTGCPSGITCAVASTPRAAVQAAQLHSAWCRIPEARRDTLEAAVAP